MLQSRGADHTFDYKSPTAVSDIKLVAGNNITVIIDCIGDDATASFCASLISSRGGKYHSIKAPAPEESFRKVRSGDDVSVATALSYTLLGEDVELRGMLKIPAQPEEYVFAGKWSQALKPLLEANMIMGHPVADAGKGLKSLEIALKNFEGLSPSGKKVVCVAE